MTKEFIVKIVRRIFTSFLILLFIISLIFTILQLAPGDPSYKYLSPELSPELMNKVKNSFTTEGSLTEKYFGFLFSFLTGDLGISFNFHQPVLDVILPKLKITFIFSGITFIIQLLLSFWLAYVSVQNAGKIIDRAMKKVAMVFYSTPSFITGIILIYIFAYMIDLFPVSGIESIDNQNYSLPLQILDVAYHMFLPALTFTIALLPIYYSYLRENLKTVINSPYIVYLRTLGTSESRIFWKHTLPNSINPVIAVAGIEFGSIMSGSLVMEVVFGIPGMGRLIISSIATNDYPLVVGCCFIAGVMIILSSFIADLSRVLIDRRLLKGIMN
ncbi:MAG: ABC transporter permease [Melioribacteraceae bacterium]|nr:ABC transporter permease [Melioribacteraceae bacterium]